MKVALKGINIVRKTLSNGDKAAYVYAWKGGPRLFSPIGSAEFVTEYQEAVKRKAETPANVGNLIDRYTSSSKFDGLKDQTKYNLLLMFKAIRSALGELPLRALEDPKVIDVLERWRDKNAERAPARADQQWGQLSSMLNWAVRRGLMKSNPCKGGERLYKGSRVDKIWSDDQIGKLVQFAPAYFGRAMILAAWTGQREGSLLKLRWSAYDGKFLTVVQEKNRKGTLPRVVVIPVKGPFKEFLDRAEREDGVVGLCKDEREKRHILINGRGRPWPHNRSFSGCFGRMVGLAGIEDRTFHDLRGTAVTKLFIAGCNEAQIATITGHSLKTVRDILDKHYFHRDIKLAEQAMDNLIAYETSQPNSQLVLGGQ